MFPGAQAAITPDKPAVVMAATGVALTFAQLDERSNRLAQALFTAGLRPGDHVAIFAENRPEFFEAVWATQCSGLYLTTVNRYLTAEEAAYIVDDCGAKALVASSTLRDVAGEMPGLLAGCPVRLALGPAGIPGFDDYEGVLAAHSPEPLAARPKGEFMLYSSGTTGRPKGIKRPLSGAMIDDPTVPRPRDRLFAIDDDTVYLSPAPLYHSAPLGFTTSVTAAGGTVVVMERFDPELALALVERERVTHSQWVPTMFNRMLKLPEEVRGRYELSSHRVAIHAAAPCPVEIKRRMIEWWGPILYEYYAGTEVNGLTFVDSATWLAHPGTVGQAVLGTIRICDGEGTVLPAGEVGVIYFERDSMPFEYHNDEAKTRKAQHPEHPTWSTLGDMGYLDPDGYLYLTDRKDFMIISGGVNIYPQEIEDVLILHPAVADVAVFGVPDEEMGEQVKAVVQPPDGVEPGPDLERDLLAYSREHLAHYKCPRSVDFTDELPRLPTGKLYKRLLRDRYWGKGDGRIV